MLVDEAEPFVSFQEVVRAPRWARVDGARVSGTERAAPRTPHCQRACRWLKAPGEAGHGALIRQVRAL